MGADLSLPVPQALNGVPRTPARAEDAITDQSCAAKKVSDEVLIEAISAGDREALAELFRRYAAIIRAVSSRVLHDTSEADDLVQDIFLFIHRNSQSFDPLKGSGRSWIVQITYHRAIDRRRHLSSRGFYTQLSIEDPEIEVSDRRADILPYDQTVQGLFGRTGLRKIKKLLTEDQWKTIQLYFFEGFTIAEIASFLRQEPGNIRNHYYRALEKLRKHMVAKKLRDSASI
jgi:RNA polymerase sigma-70 factor (ECF subfamily)